MSGNKVKKMEDHVTREDIEKADLILKVIRDKATIRDITDIFSSKYDVKRNNEYIYVFEIRR